jgi:DNA-binding beta-propeller fold protein YncE
MGKKITACVLALLLFPVWFFPVMADNMPYQGYTFNYWGVLVPAPAAYEPVRSFVGADICPDMGNFVNPVDLHVCPQGLLWVVDTGNNRIVVFNVRLELVRIIGGFYREGVWQTFNSPRGVFVTENGEIFIADTENLRVPILDAAGNYLRELEPPDLDFDNRLPFAPMSVAVDRGGRVYVIVRHVVEGILCFDTEGEFIGYFGTIHVGRNVMELFWRSFMTDTQIERRRRLVPTEFQSMAVDQYNFIFTTNLTPWGHANQVMRLNSRGQNVLRNQNWRVHIGGDQRHRSMGELAGPSQLIDVIARPHGMFTALDRTRGRVYTYDSEGNLLYVFSGMSAPGWGTVEGMSRRPAAVEVLGDDIYVLDAHQGRIKHFAPTEYGELINLAIALRYNGEDDKAVEVWRTLTALDENFELAWAGIGRSMLAAGEHGAAMYYLRRGMDTAHLSIAFRRHRQDVMQDILPVVFTGGAALGGLFILYKLVKEIRRRAAAS